MRKTAFIIASLLTCVIAKAWEVGDFYPNDPSGVPAIVVYVDESGEHGLIMAPHAYSTDEFKNFCKSLNKNRSKFEKRAAKNSIDLREGQFNIVWEWLQSAPRYEKQKVNKKSPVYKELSQLNTDNGLENQKAIVKYCQDNGIELKDYFFEAYWASQLGNDWFIPGNHELELFCLNFGNGLGDKNAIKWEAWLSNHNAWLDRLGLMSLPSMYNNWVDPYAIFPDYNLHSSTLQPGKLTEYYRLNVAVKFGNAVWFLYYGTDEPGYVVAFKYF